ncbi:MAG: hydrogenase expression/formation protein [Ectothiorhodospiraceae bacterium]|jgi:hydrogenase-1 operon protein HyaF|nr:hydrogenase expression/formation protein [Ectothiorhodospiraceae bacterium]
MIESLLANAFAGDLRRHPASFGFDDESLARMTDARDVLTRLLALLDDRSAGNRIDVSHLDADNRAVLDQILGQGEVAALIGAEDDPDAIRVQEAVMAGVWRVHGAGHDHIEVGGIPAVVREAVRKLPRATPVIPESLPEGAMNVLPVLAEIRDVLADPAVPNGAHEINLTLLPMTPVDLQVLADALGTGPITILSRGYGNCRVQASACRNVWRLTFFNSEDKMILDMLQVGDVPQAAQAANEDIAEAPARLRDIMDAYFP